MDPRKIFNATFVHEIPSIKISTQVIMTGDAVGDGGVAGKPSSLGTGIAFSCESPLQIRHASASYNPPP
ncbi:MAG: hypothetical protein IPG90_17810 [Bacteroidetes bacterium]|nr:hypothetical protein [Bacteroidota bacterium]